MALCFTEGQYTTCPFLHKNRGTNYSQTAERVSHLYTLLKVFKLVLGFLGYILSGGITESKGSSVFNFLRNIQMVFHSGCIYLHSYQQFTRVPFSLHSCQQLLVVDLLVVAILRGVRQYLIVVSSCFALMISYTEQFFHGSVCHLYVLFGEVSRSFDCYLIGLSSWC